MSIIAEPFKQGGENFPQNKIILTDGRELECYPLTEETPEKLDHDPMELDMTGQYLRIGHHKATPAPQPATEKTGQELFIDNAFYLLAHKDRILSDSRMFLCPVAIQNGLAYTGTSGFHGPTLGVYIEWWLCAKEAMQTDKKGRRRLVYHLAGSPLSGMNRCCAIREDGQQEIVTLSSFGAHWGPFMKLNQRYTEAKQLYQSYTLQQVLDILHQEDNGQTDFAPIIDTLFMKHEINILNRQIASIQEACDRWESKYTDLLGHYNEEKIRQLYAEYETLATNVGKEIDSLKEQKRNLKASLRKGSFDNLSYQRQLSPLNKRIQDLMIKIGLFKINKVRETFPDNEDITFNMIETFVHNKKNENEENQNDQVRI